MYVIVVGGGKVGLNLTRELLDKGHEVTLIESRRDRLHHSVAADIEESGERRQGNLQLLLPRHV